jgi:hypothetical protein
MTFGVSEGVAEPVAFCVMSVTIGEVEAEVEVEILEPARVEYDKLVVVALADAA